MYIFLDLFFIKNNQVKQTDNKPEQRCFDRYQLHIEDSDILIIG